MHFRQPCLDVPGSRVATQERRGSPTLPTITESMQTSLCIYSRDQKLDTGRQSLAVQEVKVSAQAFAEPLSSPMARLILSPSSWLLGWQSQAVIAWAYIS